MKSYKLLLTIFLLLFAQGAWSVGNPEYTGTPYYDISTQKPKVFKENTTRSGQIGKREVDFFEILNPNLDSKTPFPIADVELEFSCPQAETANAYFGWYVSIWKHYASGKPDEYLKGYNNVYAQKCSDKFSMLIEQNDDENDVASYYVGVQSACVSFPNTSLFREYYPLADSAITKDQSCDTSDYKLKLGVIPRVVIADTSTLTAAELKNAISLGTIKTGQIKTDTEKNIYAVETYSTYDTAGTNEVPLLFSCTAAAARHTNNWKLTVYDDKNTVVAGYPRYVNGNDCGSTLVDDKGGFKFTLPKDSPRYFVAVQSACDSQSKKTCNVETSQYNISRDVTKIYTGNLSKTKTVTKQNANFKLTRCGLNASSTLSVKVENADLSDVFKTTPPIRLQIGTTACQLLTKEGFTPAELMLGSITGNAEIIDSPLLAKDSLSLTLGECECTTCKIQNASKVTLTGTRLDLESFVPVATVAPTEIAVETNSVTIPVKVDIGKYHCEGREAFFIENDKPKVGDTTYSNNLQTDSIDDIDTVENIAPSVKGSISDKSTVNLYAVDSTINSDTILNFACDASTTRFTNDWKVLLYNSNKTLNGTPHIINSSDCASGKDGDSGAYKITIPKTTTSVRYFVAVKSACDVDDNACKVNSSPYVLSRELPTIAAPAVGSFDAAWLLTKKNLGSTVQTGQIFRTNDAHVYQVDTGTTDANLTFTCLNSVRYQNDWKVLIYDSEKKLKTTTLINGSSCGIGQIGDTGAYQISLTKDSPTYYLVVKSACESGDKTCTVDNSKYQLNRVTAAQAAAIEAAKPCFGAGCKTTTIVKPFFR
jgi:hypothetical protein